MLLDVAPKSTPIWSIIESFIWLWFYNIGGNRAPKAIQLSHGRFRMQVCAGTHQVIFFIFFVLVVACCNFLKNPSNFVLPEDAPVCSRTATSCKMNRRGIQHEISYAKKNGPPFDVELGNSWWLEDISKYHFLGILTSGTPCPTRIVLLDHRLMDRSREIESLLLDRKLLFFASEWADDFLLV
jgi:hypothetical protein